MSIPRFLEKLKEGMPQSLLFYGTSLTESGSWTRHLLAALENRFPGLVSSLNTAKGGETSVWGLAEFEERVLAHRPDVLFMEFTVNDATERFHISLADSRGNLEAMLDAVERRLPGTEIILQIMNPVIDRPPGHTGHRPNLAEYNEQWREVAGRRSIRAIDHWAAWTALLESDEARFRELVPDGLHPRDVGHQAMTVPRLLNDFGLAG